MELDESTCLTSGYIYYRATVIKYGTGTKTEI